jgi:non-ribosomal peptide synthetase component F
MPLTLGSRLALAEGGRELARRDSHSHSSAHDGSTCDATALTIGELFLRQAERTPDALAVTCAGHSVTYTQLRSAANRLGRELRRRGVGPEVTVGLCLGPSVDLIIALLGIILAGGAYVPVDPDLPRDRIAEIVSGAGTLLTVTSAEIAGDLPGEARTILRRPDRARTWTRSRRRTTCST